MPNIKQTINDDIANKHRKSLLDKVSETGTVSSEEDGLLKWSRKIKGASIEEEIVQLAGEISELQRNELRPRKDTLAPILTKKKEELTKAASSELWNGIVREIEAKEAEIKAAEDKRTNLREEADKKYQDALKVLMNPVHDADKAAISALQEMYREMPFSGTPKQKDDLLKGKDVFALSDSDEHKNLQAALDKIEGKNNDEKIIKLTKRVSPDLMTNSLENPDGSAENKAVIAAIMNLPTSLGNTKDEKIKGYIAWLEKEETSQNKSDNEPKSKAITDLLLKGNSFDKDTIKTELTKFLKVNELTGIHEDDQEAINAITELPVSRKVSIDNTIGQGAYGHLPNGLEQKLVDFKFCAAGNKALAVINANLTEVVKPGTVGTNLGKKLRALHDRNGEDFSLVNTKDDKKFFENAVISSMPPSVRPSTTDKDMFGNLKAAARDAFNNAKDNYETKFIADKSSITNTPDIAAHEKYMANEVPKLKEELKDLQAQRTAMTSGTFAETKSREMRFENILKETPEGERKALQDSYNAYKIQIGNTAEINRVKSELNLVKNAINKAETEYAEKRKEKQEEIDSSKKDMEDTSLGSVAQKNAKAIFNKATMEVTKLKMALNKQREKEKELNDEKRGYEEGLKNVGEISSLYIKEDEKYLIKEVAKKTENETMGQEYLKFLNQVKEKESAKKALEEEQAKLKAAPIEKKGYAEALAREAGFDILSGDTTLESNANASLDKLKINFDGAAFKSVKEAIEISRNGHDEDYRTKKAVEKHFAKMELHLSGRNSENDAVNPVLKAFYQELYHRNVFQELPREEKKNFYKMEALLEISGGEPDEEVNKVLVDKFVPESWRGKLLNANEVLIKEERVNERAVLEEADPIHKAKEPSSYEKLAQKINKSAVDRDGLYVDCDGLYKDALKFPVTDDEKAKHEENVAKILGTKQSGIFTKKYEADRLANFTALFKKSWAKAIEAFENPTDDDKQEESEKMIKGLVDEFLKNGSLESKKFYNKIFAEFVWKNALEETRDDLMAKYEHYTDAGSENVEDALDKGTPVANKMLRRFFELQVPMAVGGGGKFGGEMDTSLLEEEFNKRRAVELAGMKTKMRAELAAEDFEIEEEVKRAGKGSGAKAKGATGKMSPDNAARTVQKLWEEWRESSAKNKRGGEGVSEGQSGGRDGTSRGSGEGSRGSDSSDKSTQSNLGGKSGSRGLNFDEATLHGIIGELNNICNSIGAIEHRLGLQSAGPSTRHPYDFAQGLNYQGLNAPHFQQQQYQGGGACYYQGPSTFPQQHFNGGSNQFYYGPPPFAAGGPQQWGQAGMSSNGPNPEIEQLKKQLEAATAEIKALAGGGSADSKGQSDGKVGVNSGTNVSAPPKSLPANIMSGDVDIDEAIKYLRVSKKPSSMIPQIIGSSEEGVDGEKGRRGSAKILDNGLVVVQYNSADEFNEHIAKAQGNFRGGASLTRSKHQSLISLVEINVDGKSQYKVVKSDSKGIKVHQIDENQYRELIDEKRLKKSISTQSEGEDLRAATRDALMQNIAHEFSGERVSLNKQMKDNLLKQCENEKVLGVPVPGRWGGRKDKLKGAMEAASFSISDRNETVIERDHNNKNRVTVTINGNSDEDAMVSIGNGCYIKVMAKDTVMPDGTEVKAGKAAPDRIYMDGHPDGIDISGGMFRRSLSKSGNLVDALTVDGDRRGAQDRAKEIMKRYNELQLIVACNSDEPSVSFMVDGKTHGMELTGGERIALFATAAGVTVGLGVATAGIAPAAIIGTTLGIAGMASLTAVGGAVTIKGAVDVAYKADKIFPSTSPRPLNATRVSDVGAKFYENFAESGSRK